MAKGALEVKEQSYLKGISRFIAVISVVGKFLLYFAIVVLIMCMLLIPSLMKDLKAYDNKIELTYSEEKVSLVKNDEDVVVYVNDKKQSSINDVSGFDNLYKVISKHSNRTLIGYSEAFILVAILYLFIVSLILNHLSKLFKNISKEDTPFTLDNVNHLRKMGLYMVSIIIIPFITSLLFSIFTDYKLHINLNFAKIVETLIVIALYYIFKYGLNLQNDSKKKIYDDKE